ncbi:LysM peptidoglycan-binding domain-containing protein, partial [bacterium]|nr:LysM peptidoglycan-binding domain-containing protein [bacterium]
DETIEFIPGHIPITFNSKVYKNVKYFSSPAGKRGVQMWLDRSQKFKEIMLPILEKENVPPEIFYLCVIESGLNPLALSYAQASGPWQFISSTGKVYDLQKNWYIDERRDFIKSTHAAARYLKDLKKIFDKENPEDKNGANWYLAFAAYNCGASRVLKEMKRSNSNNFWDLNRLPGQTRNYVPKILAFFLISKNPEKYGFATVNEPNMEWVDKVIDKQVSFQQISEITGIDIKNLQNYNPEIKRGILPPLEENESYNLRLPKLNNYESFDSLFLLLKEKKTEDFLVVEHIVKKGDNLSRIAFKYNIKIQDITSMNNISQKKYLQPGQMLQIPTQGYDEYMQSILSSNKTKKIFYTVKSGDTLSEIAIRFRTSVKKIKTWNGIRNDVIYVGKKLTIHVPLNYKENKNKNTNSLRKIIYTVKRGDSLSGISYKYAASIKNIRKWNNVKGTNIKIGDKLIIYTKY